MLHDILKDFPGSQDGRHTEYFTAGAQADLSAELAAVAVAQGWARPVGLVEKIEQIAENVKIGTLHMKRKGV